MILKKLLRFNSQSFVKSDLWIPSLNVPFTRVSLAQLLFLLISRQFQVQSKSSLLLGGPRKFTCFAWSCPSIIGRDWLSPILRKNSRSLIIHENVFFWEENNFSKKNLNFFGQTVFWFRKNILRTTTGENLRKILRAVLEICGRLQINFLSPNSKKFFQSLQMAQFAKLTG